MIKILLGTFVLGLSFGAGPCLASCGPLLISYIAATKKDVARSLFSYTLFSLARISAYIVLSLLVFFLGKFILDRYLGNYAKYIFILGGLFISLLGILIMLGKACQRHDKKNIFLFGLVIGLLPCAPLIAALSYIGLISKNWLQNLLYSLSFGIGTFVSPLLLLVFLAGFLPKFIVDKNKAYLKIFNFVCGLIMVVLGISLLRRAF